MNKLKFAEKIFKFFSPLLKLTAIQKLLKSVGVRLPYRFAKYLDYQGLVEFKVRNKKLVMQSYNTPIEITVFWKGIFGGREGAELRVWSVLSKHIPFCLDVGANTGVYSIVAAAEENNKVHAFEPVPGIFNMLEKNIEQNSFKNLTAHELVVGDTSGVETLYIPREGWVDVASIEKDFAARYASVDTMREIQVPAITLDEFVSNEEYQKTILVKIDVEGAEYKVLRGMSQILSEGRAVVILEILNQTSFSEIKKVVPVNYEFYGITTAQPHVVRTSVYDKQVKNYLLVPGSLSGDVEHWVAQ